MRFKSALDKHVLFSYNMKCLEFQLEKQMPQIPLYIVQCLQYCMLISILFITTYRVKLLSNKEPKISVITLKLCVLQHFVATAAKYAKLQLFLKFSKQCDKNLRMISAFVRRYEYCSYSLYDTGAKGLSRKIAQLLPIWKGYINKIAFITVVSIHLRLYIFHHQQWRIKM